jgi:hypothetical protein
LLGERVDVFAPKVQAPADPHGGQAVIPHRGVQITHGNVKPPCGFVRSQQVVATAGVVRTGASCWFRRMLPALVQIAQHLADFFERAPDAVEGFLVRLVG